MRSAADQRRLEALNARPNPAWFDEAKFGIFIHWGLFAIPAFASGRGPIGTSFREDYDRAVAMTPYTEWYANAIKVEGTPSADFHRRMYGDAPYEAFKAPFLEGLSDWDPDAWAEAFADAGAKYVVLVSKHHDGFCLWPSSVANPKAPGFNADRDLVGELARAVRATGLRFGLYYSGGLDWTFNTRPMRTLGDMLGATPGGAYPAYADAQARELISRYAPDVLWNDISWPGRESALFRLFEDYYEAVETGVVNDRWACPTPASRALRVRAVRRLLDDRIKARMKTIPADEGVIPPPVPHSGFRTPEYARFPGIQAKKWEATRGMSWSFGYNRADTEADYAPAEALIGDFIDGVSKGGNLLLNVGPMASGEIPAPQLDRLKAFGAWLRTAGPAIYGARPWGPAQAMSETGEEVRFTETDGAVNIIPLARFDGQELVLPGVALSGRVEVLGAGVRGAATPRGEGSAIAFERPLSGAFAPVIALAKSSEGGLS